MAYGSDIEICAQIRSANRKVIVLSGVKAEHAASESSVSRSALKGDRVSGTAAFLGKHHGTAAGLIYRAKKALVSGRKIDGSG